MDNDKTIFNKRISLNEKERVELINFVQKVSVGEYGEIVINSKPSCSVPFLRDYYRDEVPMYYSIR